MKKTAILVVATALAVLVGCVPLPLKPTKIVTLQTAFNADEARALLVEGNNTIKGSALMRQKDGDVVTCAGNNVVLTPGTAYAAERISHLYGSVNKGVAFYNDDYENLGITRFTDTAPEYQGLTKRSVCDAQGFFEFKNLADGSFFVTTRVSWQALVDGVNWATQGGPMMHKVEVKGGETKTIVLSP